MANCSWRWQYWRQKRSSNPRDMKTLRVLFLKLTKKFKILSRSNIKLIQKRYWIRRRESPIEETYAWKKYSQHPLETWTTIQVQAKINLVLGIAEIPARFSDKLILCWDIPRHPTAQIPSDNIFRKTMLMKILNFKLHCQYVRV